MACQKRELAARSSSREVQDVKFKDPKFKYETFVRIDMKHSYFSKYNLFSINFSVIEIIIDCLLFAIIFMFMHNIICSYCF